MYEQYWKLTEKPFENTPDPRFLFRSAEHEEGLSRLLYAVKESKGAAMLTGVFGCGKTLLGRSIMKELGKDSYRMVYIGNPLLSHVELLMAVATGLGVTDLPTKKTEILTNVVLDSLEKVLLNNRRDGKRTVVLIDEAHIITEHTVWEELRLLLNFQLDDAFLLTLLLFGQPELKNNITANKQLSQRIAIRFHLSGFNAEEVALYIKHRLSVVGRTDCMFTDESLALIFKKSGGIPRRINHICDMCLVAGLGQKLGSIGPDLVQEVVADMEE